MAQTIKIKRSTGSAAPSTLASGELAYSKGSGTFYIGDPAAANTPIAISTAIINNAGTASLNTGITAAEIRTLIGVDASGTDNSTDVTLAGTPDYLTLSGQQITLNSIDLTADVTGTLPIANGGTGATTAAAARTALGVDASGTDNSTDVTLGASVTDILSITGQAISGVDAGAADAVIGWDDSLGKLTYLAAADVRTAINVDVAGTDNSTDVTLAGSLDYITISGQTITRNAIDLSTDVTGSLPNASVSGLGALATLSAVGASEITDNSVGAAELNVTGNGTAGQALVSDGDGTMTWSTISVTDNDVNVANLTARLPQITESVTIGDATDVTVTTSGNLVVTGDLTVSGTTTTVNTETINLADNVITLNSNETGTPTENAGIEVERGTSTNVAFRWNETNDVWQFTTNGTTYVDVFNTSLDAIVIGGGATSGGLTPVAIGADSYANAFAVAVGDQANAAASSAVAVGLDATANGINAIAIGAYSDARAYGTVIGNAAGTSSTGQYNTLLGYGAGFGSGTGGSALHLVAGNATSTVAETGHMLIQTSTAKIEYTATNGFVFTEALSGTPVTYDLSDFSTTDGTVTSVGGTGTVNGITLSGTVTSSGNLTLGGSLSGITVSQLDGAAVQTSGESFSDIDTALMTAAAIEDRILSKGYTTNVGDITSVQVSSTDGSISGVGTGTTGAISFDLEVATIDGGTY